MRLRGMCRRLRSAFPVAVAVRCNRKAYCIDPPAGGTKLTAQPKMSLIHFPDPRYTAYGGIVCIGGQLNASNLLRAYRRGIFPWPIDDWPLTWFCPEERAILEFCDLHIPRSLARISKQAPFRLTIDQNFRAVIEACARARRAGEDGTWITPEMISA